VRGEKGRKRSRFVGPLLRGSILSGCVPKAEPTPKVAGSGSASRLESETVFRFFHSASVGVPKTFAYFSLFLCPAFWIGSGIFCWGWTGRLKSVENVETPVDLTGFSRFPLVRFIQNLCLRHPLVRVLARRDFSPLHTHAAPCG